MTVKRHCVAPSSPVRAPKINLRQRGVKRVRVLWLSIIPALALTSVPACGPSKQPAPIDVTAHWPTFMGNSARAAFLDQKIPENVPNIAWSAGAGSGLRGMPVVTEEVIVASSKDRYINVLSRLDGSTLWRKRLDGPPVPPLVRGDLIYTATENKGKLRVLSLKDGRDIWKWNLPSVAQTIAMSGDTIYVASEEGMLHALDTRTQFEVWQARFSRAPVAGPLVLDRWVAYIAPDSLHLIDRFNGNLEHSVSTSERVAGEAASDGERLFVTTETGSLIAWSVPELGELWKTSGFYDFSSGPAIADGAGYAITTQGLLIRFELADGSARVIARAGGTVLATPTVVQNGVLVGNMEGLLSFFSRNGEPIWEVDLEGSVEGPIFVHRGQLVVPLVGPVGGALGTSPIKGKIMELR